MPKNKTQVVTDLPKSSRVRGTLTRFGVAAGLAVAGGYLLKEARKKAATQNEA